MQHHRTENQIHNKDNRPKLALGTKIRARIGWADARMCEDRPVAEYKQDCGIPVFH